VLICVARLGLSGRLLVYFCAVRVSPPGRLCWRASRPLPNPRGAHGNRGPSRWNRCHTDLSAGQAWYNRRAIRPKRRSLPPETHALGRLNRRGCVGYNERGARLQRERAPVTKGTSFVKFDRALACGRSPFAPSDIASGYHTASYENPGWLRRQHWYTKNLARTRGSA
jgi:hypothetical protein